MPRIVRLTEIDDLDAARAEIEAIFYASATMQDFESEAARAAYRDLWLGRYLRHFPDMCFVAFDEHGRVGGYLAGSPVSDQFPLPGPDYYSLFPRNLIDAYPAHIHVNVRKESRGRAIGSTLIDASRDECRKRRIAGFHAVTAARSRAADFFSQNGLAPLTEADWRERRIAFLGAELGK